MLLSLWLQYKLLLHKGEHFVNFEWNILEEIACFILTYNAKVNARKKNLIIIKNTVHEDKGRVLSKTAGKTAGVYMQNQNHSSRIAQKMCLTFCCSKLHQMCLRGRANFLETSWTMIINSQINSHQIWCKQINLLRFHGC